MPDATAPPNPPAPLIDVQAIFGYVHNLHRSLDLNEVASVVVNDGRLLWDVDRVTLALRRGRRASIIAVSGQESVHPRGNLIRSMRRLVDKVIAAGEPLKFDGTTEHIPPPLEDLLADFVQESGTRFLLIVPLFEPERLIPPDAPPTSGKVKRPSRRTIGAIVIEQMSSSQPSNRLRSIDLVINHISTAVFNSRNYSRIFLLPVWRSLGRFFEWLQGSRLAIALALVTVLVAFGVSLVYVPWTYRVDATGRLMPVVQREVFAPWDGQVVELLAEGGERVDVGQVLLKLRNDELVAEIVTMESRISEKRKLLGSLNAQRDDAEKLGQKDEALKAQGKAYETKVEIEGAIEQLRILQDRRERLTVRAPMAGVVTTFQVEQLLINRPVKRGDVLLQVMDDSADWHLELEIPEQRVGRILRAQKRKKVDDAAADSKSHSGQLAVEYRLLTQPESSYFATLTLLATRTVTTDPQGTVLEGRAALDKTNLPTRAIGADVRARIDCGTSCLGDVLFGDVIEFALKYLWW